jgi:hypothetical protein
MVEIFWEPAQVFHRASLSVDLSGMQARLHDTRLRVSGQPVRTINLADALDAGSDDTRVLCTRF